MKVSEVLSKILAAFKEGNVPEAVAMSLYPRLDVPANQWSFLNRLIVYWSGTEDARGYKQWLKSKRYVKKGAKAIYILAPMMKKIKKEETEDFYLVGFISVPVFRIEDTDGEPLDYQQLTLPEFPLMDRAKEWGLDVRAVPFVGRYLGAYTGTDIKMASPEEQVFFHELSHHAHKLILGALKPGQDWKQEIVAELSAHSLCHLLGRKTDKMGNTYHYIERYAKAAQPPRTPVSACLEVLAEVEQVLNLILKEGGDGKAIKKVAQGAGYS